MVLFSMQAHDFFENFLFNGRQLHFSEASGMRFRHVHKEFIALLDVPSDRWSLDRAGDLVALASRGRRPRSWAVPCMAHDGLRSFVSRWLGEQPHSRSLPAGKLAALSAL